MKEKNKRNNIRTQQKGYNMKTLIICISMHHGNTKKIAKTMAEIFGAEVLEPTNIDINSLNKYELIGFGSGIYGWKHHKSLLTLIDISISHP